MHLERLKYAQVILPLPLNTTFTYTVPAEMDEDIRQGSRVVVQFGRRKYYTAVVHSVTTVAPQGNFELKPIEAVLDSRPIVRRPQLQLWEWIANYYLCSQGDVYKAALPAGLKLESETFVELSQDAESLLAGGVELTPKQRKVLLHLKECDKKQSCSQIAQALETGDISVALKGLIDAGIVVVSEKLVERYRVVKEQFVEVAGTRGDKGDHARLFAMVKGAPKQEKMLMALLEMSGWMQPATALREVSKKALLERTALTSTILKGLVQKGAVVIKEKEKGRFRYDGFATEPLPTLTEVQSGALASIHSSWNGTDVTLLRGVTGSGKTEIYIHLIDYVLKQNRQALFLVPEIALTTQLTRRLQRVFGEKVLVYHSKFTDNERAELWLKMLDDPSPRVVIGARSAVFLPFASLGLVIVDEEHETSYKQHDPAPRYNGRDVAIVLASMHGAKTLLGSATPTVETYSKARGGRFGLVELLERYGSAGMPAMEIVDMRMPQGMPQGKSPVSERLSDSVNRSVSEGNQAILFLNRRGYAPVAECPHCAYIPRCKDCDVSLTYHRRIDRLVCHYCGAEYSMPKLCPVCHEPGMEIHGYGTERLEEEISTRFSGAKILRMDLDTTRAKEGYSRIIDDFSSRKGDILVGTQMVTKGLDFGAVTTVGVVNADTLLNFPDFRSVERTFNMVEQVAGRAGRGDAGGTVIVQTRQPENSVFAYLKAHDYEGYYQEEIAERGKYGYPPFTRLINIYLRHRDLGAVTELSAVYGKQLRHLFGTRVNGPEEPVVGRVQNLFIRKFMLKFELNVSMEKVKTILRDTHAALYELKIPGVKQLYITYDVDPC